MRIIYGPKPGTVVTLTLEVPSVTEIPDGKGGTIKIPPSSEGISGQAIRLQLKVPSNGDRRKINALLARSRIDNTTGSVRLLASREAVEEWRAAVIRDLVVRVDDLVIIDESKTPAERTEIHTPDELLQLADDEDLLEAIAGLIMDRVRLTEALRGNSSGRHSSSPAEILPSVGTASHVDGTVSAEPVTVTARPTDPTST